MAFKGPFQPKPFYDSVILRFYDSMTGITELRKNFFLGCSKIRIQLIKLLHRTHHIQR